MRLLNTFVKKEEKHVQGLDKSSCLSNSVSNRIWCCLLSRVTLAFLFVLEVVVATQQRWNFFQICNFFGQIRQSVAACRLFLFHLCKLLWLPTSVSVSKVHLMEFLGFAAFWGKIGPEMRSDVSCPLVKSNKLHWAGGS